MAQSTLWLYGPLSRVPGEIHLGPRKPSDPLKLQEGASWGGGVTSPRFLLMAGRGFRRKAALCLPSALSHTEKKRSLKASSLKLNCHLFRHTNLSWLFSSVKVTHRPTPCSVCLATRNVQRLSAETVVCHQPEEEVWLLCFLPPASWVGDE